MTDKIKIAAEVVSAFVAKYLISLEDGKTYKSLRRHLAVRGMTPDEYRAKWGLPKGYPMVAAGYSEARSTLARDRGFGGKTLQPAEVVAPPAEAPPEPEGRNDAGAAAAAPEAVHDAPEAA